MDIGAIWDLIILQPMINGLIAVYSALFSNFGLAIIVLTIIVRLVTIPLTLKQLRATKAMQALQPKLTELQKKHAKDKAKLAQEQMRLYKESGISPAGCLLPMLIQMPIWIALYQSIIRLLAVTPEDFLGISRYLYSWPMVYSVLPLYSSFLWLNLATPDRLLILPILVGGTMWLQQKMVTPTSADPRQQAQSRMMLWMMPLMFAFLTMQFPSGLALYWVASNIITIAIQYYITGWGGLAPSTARKPGDRDKKYIKRISQVEQAPSEAPVEADIVEMSSAEEAEDEGSGDKRQERRDGYPASLRAIRRRSGRGRSHHPKRR
ncbi:MAG: membrane protein insertase YidC [Dehalococcoidia bacterium]|nr:MAG: membrane protein insertase YidC [Dehalococcoidia bacterium]